MSVGPKTSRTKTLNLLYFTKPMSAFCSSVNKGFSYRYMLHAYMCT